MCATITKGKPRVYNPECALCICSIVAQCAAAQMHSAAFRLVISQFDVQRRNTAVRGGSLAWAGADWSHAASPAI